MMSYPRKLYEMPPPFSAFKDMTGTSVPLLDIDYLPPKEVLHTIRLWVDQFKVVQTVLKLDEKTAMLAGLARTAGKVRHWWESSTGEAQQQVLDSGFQGLFVTLTTELTVDLSVNLRLQDKLLLSQRRSARRF